MAGSTFLPRLVAWLCVSILAVAVGLNTPSALARTAGVEMQLTPSTVALGPGETAEAVLIIANRTEDVIATPSLEVVSDPAVEVALEPSAIRSLQSGESIAVRISVTTPVGSRIGGRAHFLLSYTGHEHGHDVGHVTTSTMTVEERAGVQVQDLIELKLHTTLTEMTDRRGGDIFVQITNVSTDGVKVLEVTGTSPPFIALCAPSSEGQVSECPADEPNPTITLDDLVLGPRESIAYRYAVAPMPENDFHAGKQLLVFKVRIQSVTQNPPKPGAVFETSQLDVTVFGEAQVLTILGVASFLFLPGFLILVTIRLLYVYVSKKPNPPEFLTQTHSDFYFLMITLSFLWLIVYPYATDLFWRRRDLIAGYTSSDLFTVWFAAIIVGLIAYLIYGLFFTNWSISFSKHVIRSPIGRRDQQAGSPPAAEPPGTDPPAPPRKDSN